jgi:hypothetical protein
MRPKPPFPILTPSGSNILPAARGFACGRKLYATLSA